MFYYITSVFLIVSCSMCNEFSQIFQLCQFVMVCESPSYLQLLGFFIHHLSSSFNCLCLRFTCRRIPRMPLSCTPPWRPSCVSLTGFRWATSLKPSWSARWCTRCGSRHSWCCSVVLDNEWLKTSPTSPQFLNVPMFRNVTLKCLTEIAGVSVSQYEEQFVTLFTLTMCQLKQVSRRADKSHICLRRRVSF